MLLTDPDDDLAVFETLKVRTQFLAEEREPSLLYVALEGLAIAKRLNPSDNNGPKTYFVIHTYDVRGRRWSCTVSTAWQSALTRI